LRPIRPSQSEQMQTGTAEHQILLHLPRHWPPGCRLYQEASTPTPSRRSSSSWSQRCWAIFNRRPGPLCWSCKEVKWKVPRITKIYLRKIFSSKFFYYFFLKLFSGIIQCKLPKLAKSSNCLLSPLNSTLSHFQCLFAHLPSSVSVRTISIQKYLNSCNIIFNFKINYPFNQCLVNKKAY
jgi:hypothetical protein